jgi:serine phosphatase RsbU (regulator of sigma subunit)
LKTNQVVQVGTDADGGLPLGISPGVTYPAGQVEVPPESRLLIYTDGLTDAFPQEGENCVPFGTRGIHEVLRRTCPATTEEALAALFGESQEYTGGSGRHDDTSVVVVDRR